MNFRAGDLVINGNVDKDSLPMLERKMREMEKRTDEKIRSVFENQWRAA
jgi:hypothetical protein